MYAVGGHDGWSYLNTVERWDPQARQWNYVASMSTPRSTVGVTALNGKSVPLFPVSALPPWRAKWRKIYLELNMTETTIKMYFWREKEDLIKQLSCGLWGFGTH